MSMMYCENCNKQIDTDFYAEHFDECQSKVSRLEVLPIEYNCSKCGFYMGRAGWTCNDCDNN